MAETLTIRTAASTDVIKVITEGPQGPTGAAGQGVPTGGTTGQVLRKASGTNYDTEWGAGGSGSVTYGTTAGTACEGNDGRISGIESGSITTDGASIVAGSAGFHVTTGNGTGQIITIEGGSIDTSEAGGSINTSNGGGSIDTRGTGSVELGATGTRTTLNGSASASNKTITLPNATGTVALTQQASDYEVTDATKGVIMKSPNGSRWRLTIDNNGSLLRTAIALLFTAFFMCSASAQVQDLIYGTNGVVIGPSSTNLTFTNRVTFSNGMTLPSTATTNAGDVYRLTNTLRYRDSTNGERLLLNASDNLANISSTATARTNLGLGWAALTNTNAATFRSDIGLGSLATNNSVPSGSSSNTAILQADGAGGSAFVASRTVARILTNDYAKTNWGATTFSQVTNAEAAFGTWSLDANSTYQMEWSVGYTYSTNVSGPIHGVVFSGNLYLQTNSAVGWASVPAGGGIVQIVPSTLQAADLSAGTNATGTRFRTGTIFVQTGTNAITAQFHWCPNSSNSNTLTLIKGSTVSFTKIAP